MTTIYPTENPKPTKLSPSTYRIKVNKPKKDDELTVTVDRNSNSRSELRFFELSFHKKHKDTVLKKYLPYVLKKATEIRDEKKAVKLHTVDYNGTDGLWSSCGDERIIVFTTNHKERLDAALLRPGRMDMQAEMSYCSYGGFKVLVSTYLQVKEEEKVELFGEVEGLLKKVEVTPTDSLASNEGSREYDD